MKKTNWFEFRKQLSQKASEKGIPINSTFEITGKCNLKCKMCYVTGCDKTKGTQEKTASEWLDMAKEARDYGVLYILLTGGEVFLRKDFQQIYEGIVSLGIIPSIFSNGTLIDKGTIEWLRNRPPERIGITLYGASNSTYEKVCKDRSGYRKAAKGIDLLLEAGFNVELRTTIVPDNVSDYQGLLKFADERELILKFGSYISPHREPILRSSKLWRLEPEDLANYLFTASNDYRIRMQNIGQSDNSVDEIDQVTIESPFKCSVGKNDPWITWDGFMVPCGLMDEPKGFPFVDGFEKAWFAMNALVKEIPGCKECLGCDLIGRCLTCPARLIGETGKYEKTSDYLCELAKKQEMLYSN